MYDRLITLCRNNENCFREESLKANFRVIAEFLEKSGPLLKEIESFASEYDLDEKTPGNGYRSFLQVFNSAVVYTEKFCIEVKEKKEKFFFRRVLYEKEIQVCSQMIENLFKIGENLIEMHQMAEKGTLFAKRCHHDNLITRAAGSINSECFYGRASGFQYFDSLRPLVKFVATSMAIYSEFYFSEKNIVSKSLDWLTNSGKYLLDPELCSQRVCNINKNADIHFMSNFLKLSENLLMQSAVNVFGSRVEVNRVFEIKAEPLQIYSEALQKFVEVPIPMSHIGQKPIPCRLISAKRRVDMIGEKTDCSRQKFGEASTKLVFFVHGGGWISNTSRLYEIFLREWAVKLDVPIVSVDYSLAPDVPFPRAIEEILFAYSWILKNPELVGTTGENIVFVGDSAGANLMTATLIKCIEMGIPKPQGLFCAYGIFLANLVKTPSRFMGFYDSFLPMGVVLKIFKSYGGGKSVHDPEFSEFLDKSLQTSDESRDIPRATDDEYIYELSRDYLLSPYWASDEILRQFPRTKLLSMVTDPCLDDCVDFAKKLRRLDVDTQVDILDKLAHGFLILAQFSKECGEGADVCLRRVAELLDVKF